MPVGRATLEDEPSSGVMTVQGFRINGREYLVPEGSKVVVELGAGRETISTLTVTLFPSSLRMVSEAEWDGGGR